MLARRRFSSIGIGLTIALAAAVSCGGSTKDGKGSGGSSGLDGGAAASGSGGTGAQGGVGGAGRGGTSGAGGQAGMPARCSLPLATGNCQAYFPAYFHNPGTGVCEPFVYGGCGGNDNRFETREACQAACRGGTPDMDACVRNSDCAVASPACCGSCFQETAHDLVGINFQNWDAYTGLRGCSGVTCGACPEIDELERTSQYYVSTCENGACTVVDIRETPATECATDADCELRDGSACCEGCDGAGLVSVRPQQFADLVCPNFDQGCPPCVPIISPEFVSVCTNGRCGVTRLTR